MFLPLKIKMVGNLHISQTEPVVFVCNHPNLLYDIPYINRLSLKYRTSTLVIWYWSKYQQVLSLFMKNVTIMSSQRKGGTTQKMIDKMKSNENIAVFHTPGNMGTGIAWVLKTLNPKCYLLYLDEITVTVRIFEYSPDENVKKLSQRLRCAVNTL